jgi:hypothetical protein
MISSLSQQEQSMLSGDDGGFKACVAKCLETRYGDTYKWAEAASPVSLTGLLTKQATDVLYEKGMERANRNAWSGDRKQFQTGVRQLSVLKFFARFNAGAAVAGAGAAGFQVGALGYCSVGCLGE